VGREVWSALFVIFGLVDVGFLMTLNGAPGRQLARGVSR
jgi:hypothetical protein